jgi:hypothetical protein
MSFAKLLLLPASILALLTSITVADLGAFQGSKDYDDNKFGSYPVEWFRTSEALAPRVNFAQRSSRCDDGMYTFLSPRGYSVGNPGPMILDANGTLIWTSHPAGQTYDLMVQQYQGEQYLTYWLGDDAVAGHGAGTYYMLDSSYKEVAQFKAGNKLDGDLHEFRLTDRGTALLTVYQIIPGDLSAFKDKPGKGFIWDGVVQEIELDTGNVVFQWRASEHYNFTDTYSEIGDRGDVEERAFDWFHINSIEKDHKGNYLVSARYTHSLTYIDGKTGEIIWILGGKRNMFQDLSKGKATNFGWQHDARWHDNYTTISLFDNGAECGHYTSEYSRGLKLAVNTEKMTVELMREYIHPNKMHGCSQGSTQVLPSGNVLVGYGFSGAYTEYEEDGTPLCDVHFGSRHRFETGDVQSYRVLKFHWKGQPDTQPGIKIENGVLFVSWNGATEVRNWLIQDSDVPEEKDANFDELATIPKIGFETSISLGDLDRQVKAYLRVAAVNENGAVLKKSFVVETGAKKVNCDKRIVPGSRLTELGHQATDSQWWNDQPTKVDGCYEARER